MQGASLSFLLQMNLHGQSHFRTKQFLVPCQHRFQQFSSTISIFFLISLPHLSLFYLPHHPPTSPSLSAEWLDETDIMRQVHAGKDMEAVPQSSAAVNKVKHNQVGVGCSSLRARCSQPQIYATIHHFLFRNDFFSFYLLSALISSPYSSAFVFFFYLFCLDSPSCNLLTDLILL